MRLVLVLGCGVIVGCGGQLGQNDGKRAKSDTQCTQVRSQSVGDQVSLNGIWGSSPHDLYIAGDVSTVMHSTGDGTWSDFSANQIGGPGLLTTVWGSSANDVYVAGFAGFILHTSDG